MCKHWWVQVCLIVGSIALVIAVTNQNARAAHNNRLAPYYQNFIIYPQFVVGNNGVIEYEYESVLQMTNKSSDVLWEGNYKIYNTGPAPEIGGWTGEYTEMINGESVEGFGGYKFKLEPNATRTIVFSRDGSIMNGFLRMYAIATPVYVLSFID